MSNKYVFILLIIFLLFVGTRIGFIYYANSRAQPPVPVNKPIPNNGEALRIEINDLLEEANFCNTKADCVLKVYDCPFGCYQFVNKDHDADVIAQKIQEYREAMGELCIYDCDVPPKDEEITCVSNKCVDTRYE